MCDLSISAFFSLSVFYKISKSSFLTNVSALDPLIRFDDSRSLDYFIILYIVVRIV